MRSLKIGLVPIVRPLFRGAKMGLGEQNLQQLQPLADELGVELSYVAPPVGEPEDAQQRAQEVKDADVDLLLMQYVTFATGDLMTPFLALDQPVGLWALPEAHTDGPLPQNALCGMNMALSLEVERQLPTKWFYGSAESDDFRTQFTQTVRALRARKVLHEGCALWVGGTAPGFYRLESVPDFPMTIEREPLDVVYDALDALDDDAVESRLAEFDEPSDFTDDQLRHAARMELALEQISQGYDGVALRCWPELPDKGQAMTCSGYARLADKGYDFACEGDMAGLMAMFALKAITDEPAILMDLSYLDDEAGLFWHCGNAPKSWADQTGDDPFQWLSHFNRGLPAVRGMKLNPGPVSGLRLLEDGRAHVFAGEVEDRPGGYEGVSGWIGQLRWAGQSVDPSTFMANVFAHRLPHHFVWGRGDHEATLLELCDWLGYGVLPLDPHAAQTRMSWWDGS